MLYWPFGLLRSRGNVFSRDMDLHISGYPRSGNTFTCAAFKMANPGARVESHRHIPTFVLESVAQGIPGMVLIRKPLDAATSWAIHEDESLEEAVLYWIDFHEVLLPVRDKLFFVRFEDVTSDFGAVIRAFNARWGVNYTPFEHTAENAAKCFQVIEEDHGDHGGVREMQICRPEPKRKAAKSSHILRLNESNFLKSELAHANELYAQFRQWRAAARRHRSGSGATAFGAAPVVTA